MKYTATSSIYSNVLEDQCLDFLSSIVTWLLRSDSHVQGRCMGRTRVCVKMCTSDVYIASSVCLSCTCIYLIIDGCHKLALLVNSHTLNGRIWFRHLLSDMINPFANLETESNGSYNKICDKCRGNTLAVKHRAARIYTWIPKRKSYSCNLASTCS